MMRIGGMKYKTYLKPTEYQLMPLIKLLNNKLNCILISDGVGVGKTISAGYILHFLTHKENLPGVVVCPPSLIVKWKEELMEKFDIRGVIVTTLEEFATMENEILSKIKKRKSAVYILPNSMIPKFSFKKEIRISGIVFDEIHNFRNNETHGYQSAKILSSHAKFRVGLSATPINNSINDLISELSILFPLYSWDSVSNMIDDLWARNKDVITESLVTRFTKENLGIHFAKRKIKNFDIVYPPEYASRIKSIISFLPNSKNSFFEKIIYYRLASSSSEAFRKSINYSEKLIDIDPKIIMLKQIFKKIKVKRWLIFCEFLETGLEIEKDLKSDWTVMKISGETPLFKRHQIINQFRKKSNSILIMTPVGSEGLDVQFCNAVLNFDLHWNPMKIEQRIGRIDRIGQKKDEIIVANLIVRGSIDERILQVIERKLDLISNSVFHIPSILNDKKQKIGRLYDDEILQKESNLGKNFLRSIKFWETFPSTDYAVLKLIDKKLCDLDKIKKIQNDEIIWFINTKKFKNWQNNLSKNSLKILERLNLYS